MSTLRTVKYFMPGTAADPQPYWAAGTMNVNLDYVVSVQVPTEAGAELMAEPVVWLYFDREHWGITTMAPSKDRLLVAGTLDDFAEKPNKPTPTEEPA